MPTFGLIGKKLNHSFSQDYFTKKFDQLSLKDHEYKLYELNEVSSLVETLKDKNIQGLNVTVPFKESVIPFLDDLDSSAKKVGAVNVIKIEAGRKIGYNTDYYGFKSSLTSWLGNDLEFNALILGTGGASKAVAASFRDLNIPFKFVSRHKASKLISYHEIKEKQDFMSQYNLIINTTPLGMDPNINTYPDLPYEQLTTKHHLYDLVYNPGKTKFLSLGENKGCKTKNGLEMFHIQADKSWEIWH